MTTSLKDRLVTLGRQFALSVLVYEVVVIGGIALFMTAGMLIGYLPYTDRPGPGWYGPSQTIGEIPMVGQWLRLRPWVPPIYGGAIFVVIKGLSLVPRLPRAIVRIAGAILAAAAAVVWVLATGWYFALFS